MPARIAALLALASLSASAPLPSDVQQQLVDVLTAASLPLEDAQAQARAFEPVVDPGLPKTDPPIADCNITLRCDSRGVCGDVCARGSLAVDPWLAAALRSQRDLSADADVPLCQASLPGSHNSAITLADGYGLEDRVWDGLMARLPAWAFVRTSNQLYSLTDQLNLGVRLVELDTHYFLGALRIGHCGGLKVPQVDRVLRLLNAVAAAAGLDERIRWDTETIGCVPSLSGIPPADQRTLADALAELRAWLDAHPDEVVVLFLDDEGDLKRWGQVPALEQQLREGLGLGRLFTPAALGGQGWPSVAELRRAGKQVVVASGADLGSPLVFYKHGADMCGWNEPDPQLLAGAPRCVDASLHHIAARNLTRPESSELMYGVVGPARDGGLVLDEHTIPPLLACGVNAASPDLVTPERMAAQVWSWAPGAFPLPGAATVGAADGRWRPGCSREEMPTACHSRAGRGWALAPRGAPCAAGYEARAPRTGWEAGAVARLALSVGGPGVCIVVP